MSHNGIISKASEAVSKIDPSRSVTQVNEEIASMQIAFAQKWRRTTKSRMNQNTEKYDPFESR